MEPARKNRRWWRIAFWSLALAAIGGFVWPGTTRTSYSAVCSQCLQRARGKEVTCAAFPISDKLTIEKFRPKSATGGSMLLGEMPPVDPAIYPNITGHPCSHDFKRTGFCRYGRGSISCGHSGAGMAFRPRLEVLEVIYRTYLRIPDRPLAQESIDLLDRIFPANATVQEAGKLSYDFDGTAKHLDTISLLLSVIESPGEWRAALDHFEKGFPGKAPFISDPAFIRTRLNSPDPLVRQGCVAASAMLETPPDDGMLTTMLEDPDPGVSREAGDKIFYSRRLELFGRLFKRHKPDSYRIEAMAKYSDGDLMKLLDQDEPVLDEVCFEALVKDQRLRFLDKVVERLNHRDSEAGRQTAISLIEGPRLGTGEKPPADPWEWLEPFDGSIEEAAAHVRKGDSSSGDFWLLLKSMRTLAGNRDPAHWNIAKRAYEEATNHGTSEFHTAIMAKALMEIDPQQTTTYLLNELKGENHSHLLSALAGMGLIASPDFKDAILHFTAHPPAASPGNPYPPKYYFDHGEPRRIVGYALHRCSRIQDWKLLRDKEGVYSVKRP